MKWGDALKEVANFSPLNRAVSSKNNYISKKRMMLMVDLFTGHYVSLKLHKPSNWFIVLSNFGRLENGTKLE